MSKKRLILVSNRLPVSITKKNKKFTYKPSVGGLATGIRSFYRTYDSHWIGWSGLTQTKIKGHEGEVEAHLAEDGCYPIHLTQTLLDQFYYGYSNKTLWPLFHYFKEFTQYDENMWKGYRKVNEIYCEKVLSLYKPGDRIWIHDYHLLLLPNMIRRLAPEASIGFFCHIPFPAYEMFRLLPERREIVGGLLGADLIGFHTYDYVRHFIETVRRLFGFEHSFNHISTEDREIKVDAFPMGINVGRFAEKVTAPDTQQELESINRKIGGRKVILSVDRLDYTKGIPQRLETFDLFLQKYPKFREKITLVMVVVPSRTQVSSYKQLKSQIEELIGSINGKYGTIGWTPIWYLYRSLPFELLVALYHYADVALVTPMHDGMNLIAKEYLAAKTDGKGVLVLSELAGAAMELGDALTVNPANKLKVAQVLKNALELPEDEQYERIRRMQRILVRYDVNFWARDFINSLEEIKQTQQEYHARMIDDEIREGILNQYRNAKKRLILLDYDGTLVPFTPKPAQSKPDAELLQLLDALNQDPNNEIVLISGRDRESLDSFLEKVPVNFSAEHGVWIKDKGQDWELIEPLRNDWKEDVEHVMKLHIPRAPGAFVEEKDYSLVWHYRRVAQDLGELRTKELKEALLQLISNLGLGILEGNKVLEVKNAGIDKGKIAYRWMSQNNWDFVLAIGDDVTDEDTFTALPDSSITIKVGLGVTQAKFSLKSVTEVRNLLSQLTGRNQ